MRWLDRIVIAKCSGKQTHSEGQCGQWNAVYYTGGSEAVSCLTRDPNDFCENLINLKCTAQAHIPRFLKPSLGSVKGRCSQVTAMVHNQEGPLVLHWSLHQLLPPRIQRWLTTYGIITFLLAMGNIGMESGVYQSRKPVRLYVCYPHGYQAHSPKFTESARWRFFLFQERVSSAYSIRLSLSLF